MKQILFSLILILSVQHTLAQEAYRGGEGDGYAKATLTIGQTSLSQESFYGGVTLFPNPLRSQEALTLSLGEPANSLKIDILDTAGRILLTEEMMTTVQEIRIQTESLPSGMYLLQLSSPDQTTALSFIILDL